MRLLHRWLCAAALAAATAPAMLNAQAQTSGTRFGVEADLGAATYAGLGVGGFVKFHLADLSEHPVTGRASFDYYLTGCAACGSYWQISGDGLYDIQSGSANTKPYVGAGIAYSHFSFADCDACSSGGVDLDILGGLNFKADTKLMPFAEVKLAVGGSVGDGVYGGTVFVIKGGVHL